MRSVCGPARPISGLRSILEASVYGESVTGAAIVDTNGIIVIANLRSIGRAAAVRSRTTSARSMRRPPLTQAEGDLHRRRPDARSARSS